MSVIFIRTGWYLAFGVFFGVLSFMRTNAYKQQTGNSPWHIHPVVWGIASVFVAIFGTLLSMIACSPRARGAQVAAPYGPQTQYPQSRGPGAPAQPAVMPGRALAAWLPDPTGRHELRYYDGSDWTEHVSSAGTISVDHI
jgi:hypothetical protein